MLTDEVLHKSLKRFAQTICNNELGLVKYKPNNNSKPSDCIRNVMHYIKYNGGSSEYGWTFNTRISPKFGDYLVATHHAVWRGPDGNLLDITPFHNELKHQPIIFDGSILFLNDERSKPILTDKFMLTRPLKFYPLLKKKELDDYLDSLKLKEYEFYKENYKVDLE